jgi:hypothetical protein
VRTREPTAGTAVTLHERQKIGDFRRGHSEGGGVQLPPPALPIRELDVEVSWREIGSVLLFGASGGFRAVIRKMVGRCMQPVHDLTHPCNFNLQGGDAGFLGFVR